MPAHYTPIWGHLQLAGASAEPQEWIEDIYGGDLEDDRDNEEGDDATDNS